MSLSDRMKALGSPPVFSLRGEAPGAFPNGTRVVKVEVDAGRGDLHPVGALGTVVGSLKTPADVLVQFPKARYAYSVEWDAAPGIPTLVMSWKIARAPP